MPLIHPEDCGTDATGRNVDNYCRFCFSCGAFTHPTATADAMIERGVRILVDRGMHEPDAHVLMTRTIPTLERWRAS
jgi:hypothetical protein